jgi:DCN1-like protein 1/2
MNNTLSFKEKQTQKSKINNFISVTNSSVKEAQFHLKEHQWNTERALNAFFNQPPPPVTEDWRAKASSSFFDQYKDQEDMIGAEGTERLCNDLGVDPSDVVTIILSWHMKV